MPSVGNACSQFNECDVALKCAVVEVRVHQSVHCLVGFTLRFDGEAAHMVSHHHFQASSVDPVSKWRKLLA